MRAATELTKHNVNAGASEVRREHDRSHNHEMDRTRKSWLRFAMIAFAGLVAVTSYPPAKAAPPAAKEDLRPLVRAMTPDRLQAPITLAASEDMLPCYKVRKRLWDGEGWVVRRVSIYR